MSVTGSVGVSRTFHAIPLSRDLTGLEVYLQGVFLGGPGAESGFTNALVETIL